MNRRDFFKLGGLFGASSLVGGVFAKEKESPATAPAKPINVLWVVVDDLGYGDFGCYGAKDIATPRLDALAKDGLLFERFYVSPVCSPTRASLLTGRYPQDFRMESALTDTHGSLTPDPLTAAEHFRAHGYRTACVGKWHLGKDAASHPQSQGFDRFYGFLGGAIHYYKHTYSKPSAKDESNAYLDFYEGRELCHDEGHTTDLFTAKALEEVHIAKQLGKPFFLYLSFNAPHYARGVKANQSRPVAEVLQAPEHFIQRYAKDPSQPTMREVYAALTAHVDESLGRLEDALKASGQWKNTLVVVLSDNGATLPFGGNNGVLREQKHTLWEGGIRTPLIVRLPKESYPLARRGVRVKDPHYVRDIFPTTAAIAGYDYTPVENIQMGQPQFAMWLRGQSETGGRARVECFKYLSSRAAIRGEWKWIQDGLNTSPALYRVATDLSEKDNVIAEHSDIAQELEREWNRWYAPYAKREHEEAVKEMALNASRIQSLGKEDAGYKWAKDELEKAQHWLNITNSHR